MMPARVEVLLLGATGRTGGSVLKQLLEREVSVRAIVRSAQRLPTGATQDPRLTVIEGDLTSMPRGELKGHVSGCRAVISCLGHTPNLKGVFGPPRDLVEHSVRSLCWAIEDLRPEAPVRLILMSSVSVNRPDRSDTRRGAGERAFLWAMRGLLPPARDNQRAADFLFSQVGMGHPFIEWVIVRPDTLVEGEASEHLTHDGITASLFRPGRSNITNVAGFMAELAAGSRAWGRWRGTMPVIAEKVGA